MTGNKIYLQPKGIVLSAISDLAELQNGKFTFSDTTCGKIHFLVELYHNRWDFKFFVKDIGMSRSFVELEIDGNDKKAESLINREYALLDSILIDSARIELTGTEMQN